VNKKIEIVEVMNGYSVRIVFDDIVPMMKFLEELLATPGFKKSDVPPPPPHVKPDEGSQA
jgi:hypothetical protein